MNFGKWMAITTASAAAGLLLVAGDDKTTRKSEDLSAAARGNERFTQIDPNIRYVQVFDIENNETWLEDRVWNASENRSESVIWITKEGDTIGVEASYPDYYIKGVRFVREICAQSPRPKSESEDPTARSEAMEDCMDNLLRQGSPEREI
jgi:hypothetical protein